LWYLKQRRAANRKPTFYNRWNVQIWQ
jgi:hypothetical protein